MTKKEYDRIRYLREKAQRIMAKKPDPIRSIPKIDLAYIAGIIDGEGSIHMTRKEKYGTYYAFVTVGMTDKGVIKWLSDKFGNKPIESLYPQKGSFKQKPKPVYRITLQGRRACLLCEVLLPYLKVKREHAKLLQEYPCDARIAPGKKINGSKINDIRIKLKDRLTELNGNYYKNHHPEK